MTNQKCVCGRPLHYTDPKKRAMVQKFVDELGETIPVAIPAGIWNVPRHYIALHGLKAKELPTLAVMLGFERVK